MRYAQNILHLSDINNCGEYSECSIKGLALNVQNIFNLYRSTYYNTRTSTSCLRMSVDKWYCMSV